MDNDIGGVWLLVERDSNFDRAAVDGIESPKHCSRTVRGQSTIPRRHHGGQNLRLPCDWNRVQVIDTGMRLTQPADQQSPADFVIGRT
jgi:hypothetical protein